MADPVDHPHRRRSRPTDAWARAAPLEAVATVARDRDRTPAGEPPIVTIDRAVAGASRIS